MKPIALALPTGFFISVERYPEHDPRGSYYVRVYHRDWDCQELPVKVIKSADEVVQTVKRLAKLLGSVETIREALGQQQ